MSEPPEFEGLKPERVPRTVPKEQAESCNLSADDVDSATKVELRALRGKLCVLQRSARQIVGHIDKLIGE